MTIRVDPALSGGVFAAGRDNLAQSTGAGAPLAPGVRGPMVSAAGGVDGALDENVKKSADRSGNASALTTNLDQSARAGADKVKGVNTPGGPSAGSGGTGTGLLDKANAARLAPSDVMKAALNPYQSNNPLMRAVQGIPQMAGQMIPQLAGAPMQMLQTPMQMLQSGISPFQSLLTGPAGAPALNEILSKSNASNGFDGGPASLAIPGDSTEAGKRLAQIAEGVVGKYPYAWGGGGPDGPGRGISDGGGPGDAAGDYNKVGFDCSGLAQYVWKQMYGVTIPEVSQTQYSGGIPVSAANAKPGDLVFPAGSFSSGGPGHVQILMPGGQTVLEAPSSGQMVKISPLQAGSQFRTFAAAA
ncbi:C40 family peptidase [Mycolicibacterium sp.]|uniref:C40 family peptidase n=1 Tax=Mycolicibacterium sp. TaxID=2320850 RepID=UPI0037CC6003